MVRPRAQRGQGSCRIEGCPDELGLGVGKREDDMAATMALALERLSTHAVGSEWDSKRHVGGVGG